MAEKHNGWGGARPGGGRPKIEGSRHTYTVAPDVHEYIIAHGAGAYINTFVRKEIKQSSTNNK